MAKNGTGNGRVWSNITTAVAVLSGMGVLWIPLHNRIEVIERTVQTNNDELNELGNRVTALEQTQRGTVERFYHQDRLTRLLWREVYQAPLPKSSSGDN